MNSRQGQTEGSAKTSFTVRFFMFKIILFLLFLNNLLLHLFFHLRLKLILDGLLKKEKAQLLMCDDPLLITVFENTPLCGHR